MLKRRCIGIRELLFLGYELFRNLNIQLIEAIRNEVTGRLQQGICSYL